MGIIPPLVWQVLSLGSTLLRFPPLMQDSFLVTIQHSVSTPFQILLGISSKIIDGEEGNPKMNRAEGGDNAVPQIKDKKL